MCPLFPKLPAIEDWWPYLTIGSRSSVLRSGTGALEYRVIAEIQRATGRTLDPRATLSDGDRAFLATQRGDLR